MLQAFLTVAYILVCLILLLVVLLQQGKGGDIASAFGGSSSQAAFGARAGATLLTRATTVLAVLFMVGALALAMVWNKPSGSVVSGVGGAPQSSPVKPTPPKSAPPTSNKPATPPAKK